MIKEYITANLQKAIYQLKEDTKSSYYWQSGSHILPNRLSISKEKEITAVQRKGRNLLHPIVGQMLGNYSKKDESRLKRYKPYSVRTQIWQLPNYPLIIGYGSSGITNEAGQIEDTNDLLIFTSPDNWTTITIYFFAGMASPDNMIEALEYLRDNEH